MRWCFATSTTGPFSDRHQISLSGSPRPSFRGVTRRISSPYLRGPHENGNGTRHDRGEPV